MPKRFLRIVARRRARDPASAPVSLAFSVEDVVWAMGSFCALNRKPFDPELLARQFPPPYSSDSLVHAARALGFRIGRRECGSAAIPELNLPCLVILHEDVSHRIPVPVSADTPEGGEAEPLPIERYRPAIVVRVDAESIILFEAGTNTPKSLAHADFAARYAGTAFQLALAATGVKDPDGALSKRAAFGFHWFIPELLKHRHVWRDVLIASLVIQLLALGTPLFTQVVIDKVVIHRTESTLIVVAIGLAVFMIFSALLNWVRQYLVLHTGNRVDAVLGAEVFDHLFKLPPRYFEHRPTGVIAARLHGVIDRRNGATDDRRNGASLKR